jgi:multicomponent Na+:H+ antiporter subunit B
MENIRVLYLLDVALLLMLVGVTLAVVRTKSLLVAGILLSIYSFIMALMYLVLGAPDVAMTEAAVGAGISTVLLLSGLLLVGDREKKGGHPLMALGAVALVAGALFYATGDMPRFGRVENVTNGYITAYFLARTEEDMGIPNVVSAILAGYRGYDTLGETFVIFTAAVSCLLLIGRKGAPKNTRK